MNLEPLEPVELLPPKRPEQTWLYPWIGLVFGVIGGVLFGHPVGMLAQGFFDFITTGAPFDVWGAIIHSFHLSMWPMTLVFASFGGISWAILGLVFRRLRENRLRLDTLNQEFELRVATLRHHYKNLALGIHGFSGRIKGKLSSLDETFRQALALGRAPSYEEVHPEFESLQHNFTVIEDAAQRLTHILGQELLFLKALTSDSLSPEPGEFFSFLVRCVQELQALRFREKEIRVEVNGHSLEECRETLVFPFQPYLMEVILQNIIGNAMNYGDLIRLRVTETDDNVRVEVEDNGPGLDVTKLKSNLLLLSTHLGLETSMHLLQKLGGRLLAWSKPGAGATFIIEIPKRPPNPIAA
jgi:signal transduction histidine kinase